jgi:hypothetical protein
MWFRRENSLSTGTLANELRDAFMELSPRSQEAVQLPFTHILLFLVVSFLLAFPPIFGMLPLPPPIRATCPADPILLDLIIPIILGEQYNSRSCSLCSFLHPPVTSSLSPQHPVFRQQMRRRKVPAEWQQALLECNLLPESDFDLVLPFPDI